MKVLSGINIEKPLTVIIELFTLYILDQGLEEGIIIPFFKIRPLTLVFFDGYSVDNSVLPLKYLFPPFLSLFSIFFSLLGLSLALRGRLGGLGLSTIPAGLYDLIRKKWASILHNIYIDMPDIDYMLYLRKHGLNSFN